MTSKPLDAELVRRDSIKLLGMIEVLVQQINERNDSLIKQAEEIQAIGN